SAPPPTSNATASTPTSSGVPSPPPLDPALGWQAAGPPVQPDEVGAGWRDVGAPPGDGSPASSSKTGFGALARIRWAIAGDGRTIRPPVAVSRPGWSASSLRVARTRATTCRLDRCGYLDQTSAIAPETSAVASLVPLEKPRSPWSSTARMCTPGAA